MKKTYNIPKLEIIGLSDSDVIRTSDGEWELPPIEFNTETNSPANTDNG